MTVAKWVGVSKAKHKTWTRKWTISGILSGVAIRPDLSVRRGLVRSGQKPEANPAEDGRRSQTLDRITLGFRYSPRGWRVPRGFLMLKKLKLLLKLTEKEQGEWWMRNSGRRPAARWDPPCCLRGESVLQRSGLRHLGMRTLVPFVLGNLVNCYTGVTEFKRFLERWALRCLDIIIGQQSWNTNKSRHHFPPN